MGRTLKINLAGILFLVVALVIFDSFKVKPTNWERNYKLDYKNPYDLYIFNHELKNLVPDQTVERVISSPYEYIEEQTDTVTYFVIKHRMYDIGDSILLEEVKKGNNLFVSSEMFFRGFTDSLGIKYLETDNDYLLKKQDVLRLSLMGKHRNNAKFTLKQSENSYAFTSADTANTTLLGTQKLENGKIYPNFLKIKYGKGFVYIHNQPQVFTNVALLDSMSSAEYIAQMMALIPKDKPIVWFVAGQSINTDVPVTDTSLSVVFRYPALRAVWLIVIYGLLVYILFNAKRMQRIVPVIKPLRNTSIEFVQTIANLYFLHGDMTNIVHKKIIYFLDRVRTQYHLDTSKTDSLFTDKLKNKSGKDSATVEALVEFINKFNQKQTATKADLLHLNKLVEDFWATNQNNEKQTANKIWKTNK